MSLGESLLRNFSVRLEKFCFWVINLAPGNEAPLRFSGGGGGFGFYILPAGKIYLIRNCVRGSLHSCRSFKLP